MKKGTKYIIIISLALIFLGATLGLIGWITGAKMGVYIDKSGIHFIEDEIEEKKIALDAFENIDLEVDLSNIELKESDHFGLYYKQSETADFKYEVKANTLSIVRKAKKTLGFNFFHFKNSSNTLIIYYPKDTLFKKIDIDTDSSNIKTSKLNFEIGKFETSFGNIDLRNMTGKELELETDSGNITLIDSTVPLLNTNTSFGNQKLLKNNIEYLTVKIDSGNCNIEDSDNIKAQIKLSFGNLEATKTNFYNSSIKVDSGKVKIEGDMFGSNTLKTSFGNIILNLEQKEENYNYDLDIDFGNIKINGDKKKSQKIDNHSENDLILKTDSGNISIETKK